MPNVITYPGVAGVKSATVTTSVGVTPAVIELVCGAGATPATTGTLVLGDGATGVTLTFPDCCCRGDSRPKAKTADEVVVRLQDRRWRWKYGFPVDGHYNQEAGSGKLVPWAVRSPWQLAYLLLTRLGELANPADQIDLPGGLALGPPGMGAMGPLDRAISPAGQYLGLGQNYALTSNNPETRWASRPAAQALADLAEYYGRLLVLDPIDDRVRLVRLGVGAALPAGGRIRTGPATQRDAIPATVTARGSPTEYQVRFRLRAVGREGDRSWRPIHELSYAPDTFAQAMRCLVYGSGAFDPARVYAVTLNGVEFAVPAASAASFADVAAALAVLIAASGDPRVAGQVTAVAAAGGRLQIDAATTPADGYEFELTTAGTDDAPPGTWAWTAACVRGPVRGTRERRNAWRVTFPDAQPTGTILTVTANAVATAVAVAAPGDFNALADAVDRLAALIDGAAVAAAGGGRTLVATRTAEGVVMAVTATSSTGAAPVVDEVATALAPAKGWERCGGVPGPFARGTNELSYPEAKRLAAETVFTCYQVVCEDPADGTVKTIPVPDPTDPPAGTVAYANQFLLLLQPDSPEPVEPRPGDANVLDARTGQAFAATTYNGYAVRRPNRAYGSVAQHILARDGLLWRGGTYLQHNTPPRKRLPVTFSVVDPEMQVVQFSQPLYRWLGSGAASVNGLLLLALYPTGFTTHPAELVIECGATALDPDTLAPRAFEWSVAVPGGFGPALTRVFPDVRREVIGEYDGGHGLTAFRDLDADAEKRATAYARGLADTFQAPAGESVEFDGLKAVSLDGAVRQIRWWIGPGEPGVSTSVDVNCETSRVVPPYPARRRAEGLPPNGDRAAANLASDFLARAAAAARNNALGAAAGGGFHRGGR